MEQTQKLESFVKFRGKPIETLAQIEHIFSGCESGKAALKDLAELFKYTEIY